MVLGTSIAMHGFKQSCYVRIEISEAIVKSGQYPPIVSSNLPPEPM